MFRRSPLVRATASTLSAEWSFLNVPRRSTFWYCPTELETNFTSEKSEVDLNTFRLKPLHFIVKLPLVYVINHSNRVPTFQRLKKWPFWSSSLVDLRRRLQTPDNVLLIGRPYVHLWRHIWGVVLLWLTEEGYAASDAVRTGRSVTKRQVHAQNILFRFLFTGHVLDFSSTRS